MKATAEPLGWFSFGFAAFMYAFVYTDMFKSAIDDSLGEIVNFTPVLPQNYSYGFWFGAVGMTMAGLYELERGATRTYQIYFTFASFWASLVSVDFLPATDLFPGNDRNFAGGLFLAWSIFSFLFIPICLAPEAADLECVMMGSWGTGCLLMALKEFTGEVLLGQLGGYLFLLVALCAFVVASGGMINGTWKKEVVPLRALKIGEWASGV